ncbi:UNVERIFIED_CONTAM: IRK-interacting protein [Sesamum radiatum]|uniref:IRK-interacting protein n=1 Tax=Sesamum radiatum TaxID=300843 RepID=A0AAW2W6F3_SESRA
MADIYQEQGEVVGNGNDISREDIQATIAKTAELRALHAALMQGNSPASLRFPSASPVSRHSPHLSAQDYPVFTPFPNLMKLIQYLQYKQSYDDEPLPGYQQILVENRNYGESWGEHAFDGGNIDETVLSDYRTPNASSRKGLPPDFMNCEVHVCPADDQVSVAGSCVNNSNVFGSSPGPDYFKRRRNRTASVETLRKELTEANESRDAALNEVAEMKSSLEEFSQKLEYLETYCEELKKALRQAVQVKISLPAEKLTNPPRRGKSIDGIAENSMPVSEEVMVEGFLQIVSEARLSVKQFCKTLLGQLDETDHTLVETLNLLLQPYKLSLNSKYSKAVLYHLEAIINQSLYQDFENCVFQKNGSRKLLDPQQDRQARFQSFVALRNLSWNEVLRKGTKFYSEDFSKFCDQKMSGIITTLGWTRPWSEQLLQAFFVAAKCIWLLHLLAFSFNQPLGILRVDENVPFESDYMEDIFTDRQRSQGPGRVKIMVMPGFYVLDRVLKCKVLCRYKSVS